MLILWSVVRQFHAGAGYGGVLHLVAIRRAAAPGPSRAQERERLVLRAVRGRAFQERSVPLGKDFITDYLHHIHTSLVESGIVLCLFVGQIRNTSGLDHY